MLEKLNSKMSWDQYFMAIVSGISHRSKDPNTNVGAIIVNNNYIIGTGYNGFPPRVPDFKEIWDNRDTSGEELSKYDVVIHAEMNAIIHSTGNTKDGTIYCTHIPCLDCAKHIISAGILRVLCFNQGTKMDLKTAKVIKLFELARVEFIILPIDF